MNVLSDFKLKKTVIWLMSMVFSFTSYVGILIYIKKMKFFHYASWMYKGDFNDSSFVLKLFKHYHSEEIYSLYLWLPVCLVLDIVLRKLVLPSVRKPQHTV